MSVSPREKIGGPAKPAASKALRLLWQGIASNPCAHTLADMDFNIIYANDTVLDLWGYRDQKEIAGLKALDFWADRRAAFDFAQSVIKDGTRTGDLTIKKVDGSTAVVRLAANVIKDEAGAPVAILGVYFDISEDKAKQDSLREGERRLKDIADLTADYTWEADADCVLRYVSERIEEITGYPPKVFLGRPFWALVEPLREIGGDMQGWEEIRDAMEARQAFRDLPMTVKFPDGHSIDLATSAKPLFDEDGNLLGYRGATRDITRQAEAERTVRQQSLLMQEMRDAVVILDENEVIVDVNRAVEAVFGRTRDEILGLEVEGFRSLVGSTDEHRAELQAGLASDGYWRGESEFLHADGSRVIAEHTTIRVGDEGQNSYGRISIMRDITARKQAERALYHSERSLARAQERAHLGSWEIDLNSLEIGWSDEMYRIYAVDAEEGPSPINELMDYIHPDDRPSIGKKMFNSSQNGDPLEVEFRIVDRLGMEKVVVSTTDYDFDADGKPVRSFGTTQDVTATRHTEGQLRQAQKMETIGLLSAGVAHDFNNLLSVIIGNLELIEDISGGQNELEELAENAIEAGERGADLTRRLLAFSRRQTLFPVSTDINQLIDSLTKLIARTIGQSVEIEFIPGDGLWPARVDAGQLEAGLLNLAVNSRDAMADGGKLTIRSKNVRRRDPNARGKKKSLRDYVCIEVKDTGMGMSADVLEKAVEPFFTTKESGKGSGLGLSMVYGFVSQSGGEFEISSKEGRGTTVQLFLPKDSDQEADDKDDAEKDRDSAPKGHTILVVEDDSGVREVVRKHLEGSGYDVYVAPTAEEALEILARTPGFSLLFTDIVLGRGMNGVQLASEAMKLYPAIKVLCTSGYAESTIFADYPGASALEIVAKPVARRVLLDSIAQCLDGD